MEIRKCKVCGNYLFNEPLLIYKNMPSIAQNFPTKETLVNDNGADLFIYQCSGCGLVQLTNKPVSYYKEVIRSVGFSPEMKEFRLRQFQNIVERYKLNNKKVIEIGCGKGEYISLINEMNVNVYGIEEKKESVVECKENGLKVTQGYVEDENYKIENGPFDAFFILSFLEHIPNINSFMRGIYNNLNDGAIGIVEVPNFDMILKNKLFSEFMTDHLYYFTKETLSTTLKMNGFEVLECNVVWHDYIISAIVKKRLKTDLSEFHEHQEKIKNEIYRFIEDYGNKNVAVWGAGHQALAVISMTKINEKIKYVIDSATFKQGKYTPVTHIPIISPETINLDPVKAIIVMAAAYSDEVSEIIKQKFPGIKIGILKDYGLKKL